MMVSKGKRSLHVEMKRVPRSYRSCPMGRGSMDAMTLVEQHRQREHMTGLISITNDFFKWIEAILRRSNHKLRYI